MMNKQEMIWCKRICNKFDIAKIILQNKQKQISNYIFLPIFLYENNYFPFTEDIQYKQKKNVNLVVVNILDTKKEMNIWHNWRFCSVFFIKNRTQPFLPSFLHRM